MDGCLDAWDILYHQRAPLLSIKVADEPLHCLKVHEAGCLVATGCDGGNVALLELAEGLASAHRNDKTSVAAVSIKYRNVSYQDNVIQIKVYCFKHILAHTFLRCLNEKLGEKKYWKPEIKS